MGVCVCAEERKITKRSQYCFFTYGFIPSYSKTLFKVDRYTLEFTKIVDNRFNFENLLTVQVNNDLYGYQHFGTPARLVQFSGLASGQHAMIKKAAPPTAREFPSSPLNFKDSHLFVTGGRSPADDNAPYYKSVDIFDIRKNTWSEGPPMNFARAMHNTCLLGDSIYAFGGIKNAGQEMQ